MDGNCQSVALAGIAAGLLLAAAPAETAWSACFEDVGCTNNQYMSMNQLRQLSCQNLWTVRNFIYHNNGYWLESAQAKGQFSNQGCVHHDMATVPLNAYERANVQSVRTVEQQKGC